MIATTKYKASVHLTLHLMVDSASPDAASDEVRGLIAQRPGIRADDISEVVVRPMSAEEILHDSNLIVWQETEAIKLGTDDQRARYAVGALPDEELCRLARGVLFTPFDGFEVRKKLTAASIGHPRRPDSNTWRCATPDVTEGPAFPIPVTWATLPTPVLTPTEWGTLARINHTVVAVHEHPWLANALTGPTVATRIHRGTCQRCWQEVSQVTALVTIAWAGRTLSREYLL